jgi:thiosulfate dehydrogenase
VSASFGSSAILILLLIFVTPVGSVHAAGPAPFNVPAETTVPSGPEGEAIKLGKALITDTRKLLPNNVGNGLNCTNCHVGAGTTASAAPYVGLWGAFPEYWQRRGTIDSLQERVNDCFRPSMNGKALAYDSKEMNAILI